MKAGQGRQQAGMDGKERRAAVSLAGMFGLRMLGLFLVLPVFSIYAHQLEGVREHPALIGLALGAYGLTQALLQIPFGMLSDRYGRKPVILIGTILFIAGSWIAAASDSIYGVLIGRIVQGAGAVASVIIALSADLTREENRTKAMAMIGITIGLSFAVSLVLGPLLASWIGVDGIFWLIGGLGLISLIFLYTVVPTPKLLRHHRDAELSPAMVAGVMKDPELLRLDFGVFALHAALTALFVVLPLVLMDPRHPLLPLERQWELYLPVMLIAFALMVPFIIIAESRRKMKQVFVGAIATLAISVLIMALSHDSLAWIALALLVFFTGFNVLEASLPSLISKISPAGVKGTAIGVYTTAEFLGAFVGGAIGGLLYDPVQNNYATVFWAVLGLFVAWLLVAIGMRQPRYVATRVLHVGAVSELEARAIEARLLAIPGVVEAAVFPDEEVAYCKVDSKVVDESALAAVMRVAGDEGLATSP
ncbi:MFS transporter [Thermithiobacillus plumbiphilus]|uniref:MFS transporter n=1 Tax=Thermithiobacillus plumbiphilus TaxID=1729899 RepID=A0ABU9DAN0_9PROT